MEFLGILITFSHFVVVFCYFVQKERKRSILTALFQWKYPEINQLL